jgi:hypothetical protein
MDAREASVTLRKRQQAAALQIGVLHFQPLKQADIKGELKNRSIALSVQPWVGCLDRDGASLATTITGTAEPG